MAGPDRGVPGSTPLGRLRSFHREPTRDDIIPAADLHFSLVERIGWLFTSHRVWPRESLQTPFFAYFLSRRRGIHWESAFGAFPGLALLMLGGVLHQFWPPAGFWTELAFCFSVSLLHLLAAPFMGLLSLAITVRTIRGSISREMLQEVTLTTYSPPIDLVMGVGGRVAANASAGFLVLTLGMIALSNVLLIRSGVDGLFGSLAMILLLAVQLYGALAMRVFSDQGIACATRACFLIDSRYDSAVRAVLDFVFWAPILFLMVPIGFSLVIGLLNQFGAFVLVIPVALGLPVTMAASIGVMEEKAADILQWTAARAARLARGEEVVQAKRSDFFRAWPKE